MTIDVRPCHQSPECFADADLRVGVHAGCRLVEYQVARIVRERAGEADQLLLPGREAAAPLPDWLREAFRQACARTPSGSPARPHPRPASSEMPSVPSRMLSAIVPVNRYGSCSTIAELPPQFQRIDLAHVDAADADAAALDVVEAQQQVGECRLARAGVARPRRSSRRVRCGTDIAAGPSPRLYTRTIRDRTRWRIASGGVAAWPGAMIESGRVQQFENRSEAAMARLQDVVLFAEVLNRPEETHPVLKERRPARASAPRLDCGSRRRPACRPARAC